MNMSSYSCCTPTHAASAQVAQLSRYLRIILEESRLRLLCILQEGEHCVCEMLDHVDMSQSLVSHHLKDLKDAGLVSDQKRGLRKYYSLTDQGKQIAQVVFSIPIGKEPA